MHFQNEALLNHKHRKRPQKKVMTSSCLERVDDLSRVLKQSTLKLNKNTEKAVVTMVKYLLKGELKYRLPSYVCNSLRRSFNSHSLLSSLIVYLFQ